MIYFRQNNGELGAITYGSLEEDLEMLGSRFEMREDVVNSIGKFKTHAEKTELKPKPRTAFLAVVN